MQILLKSGILSVTKLANFVTKFSKYRMINIDNADGFPLKHLTGKRLTVPSREVNRIYEAQRKRRVRVEYIGPTKTTCLYCGVPFLFESSGRGRNPEYHSNACKQKAYRGRKKDRQTLY